MKIRCITNRLDGISKEILKNYSIDGKFSEIEIGREYIVYAIWVSHGYIWYCISRDSSFFIPKWKPSMLFEITDNRLSRYWTFGLDEDEDNDKKTPFLSFPEWTNDSYFYSELIEGNRDDPNAIIFRKYKELMDFEFPDPSITSMAQIGDDEWLICPECIDAWKSKSDLDALLRCPKCWKIYNNPRYKNEWPHL